MGKLSLLFVEDEPDIREIVTICFGLDPDVELTVYTNAVEALEQIEAEGLRFEYALMNLHLPAMTGVELHFTLRRIAGMEHLKTVLITAASPSFLSDEMAMPGIAGVIAKPFETMKLAAHIKGLFADYESGAAPRIIAKTGRSGV